jgi:HAE1 family hydrophobic/amphiphilic exporter-1
LSYGLVTKLKKEFIPPQDQSMLMLRAKTPVGSSLEFTDKKVEEIEKDLNTISDVKEYFTSIGGAGGTDVNTAILFVTFKPLAERSVNPKTGRNYKQAQLGDVIRERMKGIKDVRIAVQDPSLSGFSAKRGYPIEFSIQGPAWDKLIESSKAIMEEMEATKLMSDVDSDYQEGMPEIQVIPDRQKARDRGVSVSDISETINAMMGGYVPGKFSKNGHRYDVRVQLVKEERRSIEDIKRLNVRNNRGELVPIPEVVKFQERPSLQAISRLNRERAISVFANLSLGASQAKAIEQVQAIASRILPSGYHIVTSGSAKTFQESFQSLIVALVLGIVVAYMVLASQFNSFLHPITVLVALPFSVSGAFVALLVGGQSLNIYSMIGLILLMGIVKKNSILLVDFTNQVRVEGSNVHDALLKACPIRLRPILMTSLATIAGALPAAFAVGPGAESRIPMAICVIGGVAVSTVLTLFVVPCVYSLFSRLEGKKTEAHHPVTV